MCSSQSGQNRAFMRSQYSTKFGKCSENDRNLDLMIFLTNMAIRTHRLTMRVFYEYMYMYCICDTFLKTALHSECAWRNNRRNIHKTIKKIYGGPVERPRHPPLAYFSCLESGMFHKIITNIPNMAQSTSLGSDPMKNSLSPVIKKQHQNTGSRRYLLKIYNIYHYLIVLLWKKLLCKVPVHQN